MLMFDSSAIIEMTNKNKEVIEKYRPYDITTINLIYGEVYLYCLKTGLTEDDFSAINFQIVDFELQDIKEAMKLLHIHKKATKDFSFVDAVVYTVAKKNNLKLVTKDYGFKGLQNVEFITE